MTSRRSFMGQAIGIFAGTQVPWIARRPRASPIVQPTDLIPGYRTAIRLANGRIIQGPGVKAIKSTVFQYAPIEARRELKVVACRLFLEDPDHGLVMISDVPVDQLLINGDSLHISHDVRLEINGFVIPPDFPAWRPAILTRHMERSKWLTT